MSLDIQLTPRQSRWLAVSLLVLVAVGLGAAIMVPTLTFHRKYDEAIAFQQDLLERNQRKIAQKPQLEDAIKAVEERNGRRFFLENTAENRAGIELQEEVRIRVESSGGRVNTSRVSTKSQSKTSTKEDGVEYQKISVVVAFSATAESLQKAIHSLESRTPYLVIDSLAINSLVSSSNNFKPEPGKEREVRVEVEVSGWAYRNTEDGGAT